MNTYPTKTVSYVLNGTTHFLQVPILPKADVGNLDNAKDYSAIYRIWDDNKLYFSDPKKIIELINKTVSVFNNAQEPLPWNLQMVMEGCSRLLGEHRNCLTTKEFNTISQKLHTLLSNKKNK